MLEHIINSFIIIFSFLSSDDFNTFELTSEIINKIFISL